MDTGGKSRLISCRSKGVEEADIVLQDKLTGFLFTLGCVVLAFLFSDLIVKERVISSEKLVTFSVSFASGKLCAQQAVQARILYKIRLNKAISRYGSKTINQ